MEKKISFSEVLKKYTMVIGLVFVVIMFSVNTKGVMLLPQNVNNLVVYTSPYTDIRLIARRNKPYQ